VKMSSAAKKPISLDSTAYRKHFIPLESNPEVFTELIHKLGIADSLKFQDVLSLDDPDLLGFLPQPAYALILVFPTTEAYEKRIKEEDGLLQVSSNQAEDHVLFFRQTINNACGLYAILHAACNGAARGTICMYIAKLVEAEADVTQANIQSSTNFSMRQESSALRSAP
jgi:hypothetical protein